MKSRDGITREDLAGLFGEGMKGQSVELAYFGKATGTVKTTAVEANLSEESPEAANHRIKQLASELGLRFRPLGDATLASVSGDDGTLVFDVLDPRFWLVHSVSRAEFGDRVLRSSIWKKRDLDWCWLPRQMVEGFRLAGEVRWFKTDFEGEQLAPDPGQKARRLRVQLDGDGAFELLQVLQQHPQYRHAASLTALAATVRAPGVGEVQVIADYKGRFAGRGDSFEIHVGVTGALIRQYSTYVRALEHQYALAWHAEEGGGASLSGEVVVISFQKEVSDFDGFLAGMFSCRDPFRLWGVPRVTESFATIQAVDLHVGAQLPMDITRSGVRVYLREGACGNTLARLLANLQHRYDATIEPPSVGDQTRLVN